MSDKERLRVAEIMLDREVEALANGEPLAHTTRAANWAVIAMEYRSRVALAEDRLVVTAGGNGQQP